jgi:hypothetical protein
MDDLILTVDDEVRDVRMGRPHVVILGAGASRAAFPQGDANGCELPLMNDFIQVLNLEPDLEKYGIEFKDRNFEEIYSDLYERGTHPGLVRTIEDRTWEYFSKLRISEAPTIYDHLVLSLRDKDLIATFNWDPFLFFAGVRNYKKASLPHVVYLHGNVAVGHCLPHRKKGAVNYPCIVCNKPYTPSKLLFPIKQKNYINDQFISAEWKTLRRYLRDAFIITIFGYSAPKSDIEAIKLMKEAWGSVHERNLEEIEVIDIKPDDELVDTWHDFIHTHHYITSSDFYESFIAKHPRRTCEAMWSQIMDCKFISDNNIPKHSSFEEIWEWFQPLIAAEDAHSK